MNNKSSKPDNFRLLLFNPETDYALACGRSCYSPPARIRQLRESLALLPALYGRPGDAIIIPDTYSADIRQEQPSPRIRHEVNLRVIKESQLPHLFRNEAEKIKSVLPWGWNHSLRKQLLAKGAPPHLLKSEESIDKLRELSHRRISITARHRLHSNGTVMPETEEIFSVEKACDFINRCGLTYFKLPWSSSGRGVVRSDSLSHERLFQWVAGGIRTQGSVIAEKALEKKVDFASEWWVTDGVVRFEGLSLFSTGSNGRYGENIFAPQSEIEQRICKEVPGWNPIILDKQKSFLEEFIAPDYEGPLGIDMLATFDGMICPFIEINLRMTMGMAACLANYAE